MKYLLFFTLTIILYACGTGTPGEKAAQSTDADSALYAPLILPLTDSINLLPGNADLHFRRALLLFNTDPVLAQKDFEKAAELKPATTDYWAGAGESALMNENYTQAVVYFEKALHTSPGYSYLQYRLATALIENKQYHRADSLASVLAASPGTHDKAYYLKARIAEDRKDTTLAIKHLSSAIDVAGMQSDYDAVMELGDLLTARRSTAALRYYQLASRLDSFNTAPLYAIGQFYEQQGKQHEAIAAYKRCINTDPDDEDAYVALGKISIKQQQWETARSYFNMAAKAAPTDAASYYYRGLCQEKLGKKQEAIEDYAKALTFRRNYPEAKEALRKLKD